ncbi:MAG TPA: MBL fold metallo-hydrolase [Chloroflexia bacterium]|nr:MBL fold metallo-hydrolase [Chloroflexia bacterium]
MADLVFNFLDVGQGDGTFISCPTGKKILVDFGTVKNGSIAVPDATKFLKTQFKTSQVLDLLVVTHADHDHYNKIESLVDDLDLTVNEIWISGKISDYKVGKFNSFLTARKKVVKTFPKNHLSYVKLTKPAKSFGDVNLYILSVNLNYPNYRDPNPYSLVLMVEYNGVRCVLPGDATFDTENAIVKNYGAKNLASYALKMGHHGSAVTSSGPKWISAINPQALFVSADNRFNHPSCAIISQFTNIGDWKKHDYYCYDADDLAYGIVSTTKSICTSMISKDQGVQYAFYIDNKGAPSIGDTNY